MDKTIWFAVLFCFSSVAISKEADKEKKQETAKEYQTIEKVPIPATKLDQAKDLFLNFLASSFKEEAEKQKK